MPKSQFYVYLPSKKGSPFPNYWTDFDVLYTIWKRKDRSFISWSLVAEPPLEVGGPGPNVILWVWTQGFTPKYSTKNEGVPLTPEPDFPEKNTSFNIGLGHHIDDIYAKKSMVFGRQNFFVLF